MTGLFILGYLLVTLVVIYFSPRILTWAVTMVVYFTLVYFIVSPQVNYIVFTVFAIISAITGILVIFSSLRIVLSRVIFSKARGILPSISETEQLALNAGDSWYEQEIFRGKPNFEVLHNIKKFQLTPEEQNFLDNEVSHLCALLDDWEIIQKTRDLPEKAWNYIREKKFFGLVIAKEYGGHGFSAAAHSQIVLKISTKSPSAAVCVMVPNSLGPGELLFHYGTTEQKNYYLPRLVDGREIPCFALTGPTAGSDATSIPDEGLVCYGEYNGQNILGIKLLNVDKRYITLAPVATLVGLAFQLKDPEGLLNGLGRVGITCALLPHNHPGLEIGNRLYPLKQAFMNGTVRIKETFIPMDWVIGGQKMAGEGWRMLVECLSIGRAISLPACGTSNALFSTVMTSAYAIIREQFKVSIGSFEGVEEALAKMGGLTYMMNATRQFTVTAVDVGIRPSVASAIAKYHLTENGRVVLNHAMDIHAGRAIIEGPNNYLASAYMAVPVAITVEGANIMTRNLMIFGQGAMRSHPFIRTEYESLTSGSIQEFDKAMFGHIAYFLNNMVRSIFHAFTGGMLATGYKSSKFNCYYKQITRLSAAFAYANDVALIILGGELKRKERLSARFGDVMSYLYMACASLKYFKDTGEQEAQENFVIWVMQHCLFEAQTALTDALDNFTLPAVGKLIKFILFPYGKSYKKPADNLEFKVAQSLLLNSSVRKEFRDMCYIPEDYTDIAGRMEVTFKTVLAVAPIKYKIRQAIKTKQLTKGHILDIAPKALALGIITSDELDRLQQSAKYVNEVIQVDEFSPFELGPKNAHPTWK
ncbi:MAG: fadE [Burkholderiales bacterium]|jgi:acyl-CoA dehydrogenase|nr:fadE [Burkholderiales bacterium]